MSDNDLIRRGDAIAAVYEYLPPTATRANIRDLPAVTPTLAEALAVPEVRALVEALRSCPPTSNPTISHADNIRAIDAWWRLEARAALAPFKEVE